MLCWNEQAGSKPVDNSCGPSVQMPLPHQTSLHCLLAEHLANSAVALCPGWLTCLRMMKSCSMKIAVPKEEPLKGKLFSWFCTIARILQGCIFKFWGALALAARRLRKESSVDDSGVHEHPVPPNALHCWNGAKQEWTCCIEQCASHTQLQEHSFKSYPETN